MVQRAKTVKVTIIIDDGVEVVKNVFPAALGLNIEHITNWCESAGISMNFFATTHPIKGYSRRVTIKEKK